MNKDRAAIRQNGHGTNVPAVRVAGRDRDKALEGLAWRLRNVGRPGEAMIIGELDGFVAGLLLSPEIVPASQWLPVAWGPDTEFASEEEADETAAALIGHYNAVARTLASEPENYGPVLEVEEPSGRVFWVAWMRGFNHALELRTGAWERIERDGGGDVVEALGVMRNLYAAADEDPGLGDAAIERLASKAPVLIGGVVRNLNKHKQSWGVNAAERLGLSVPRRIDREAARAAPCACCSGRPYRDCCGT